MSNDDITNTSHLAAKKKRIALESENEENWKKIYKEIEEKYKEIEEKYKEIEEKYKEIEENIKLMKSIER